MLILVLGAAAVVLILLLVLRRKRRSDPKKPWPKRLVDWLLARELAEDKPRTAHKAPAARRSAQAAPRRTRRPDPDQTDYIRPVRTAHRPRGTISLSYATEPGGRPHAIPVDHLPFRVGARGDCDYVIDNDTVSREHFEVFRDAYGEVCVRNLSRTNGLVPLDPHTGNVEEPILQPGVVLPIDRDSGTLRFWAGELLFTLSLVTGRF